MIRYSTENKIRAPDFKEIIDRKKIKWCPLLFTLDIEVSSGFVIDGEVIPFDFSKDKSYYKDKEKISLCYIWQFGIEDVVYYGRTLEELKFFLEELDNVVSARKIIFVHNLSYEYQFLLNILLFDTTFARNAHKVMKATSESINSEFRCSYFLTRLSLVAWAESKKLPVKKLEGELDYNIIRTPLTKLTVKELDYCEHDILVMYHGLCEYRKRYKHPHLIPLTQTGEVRRELKKRFKNDGKYNYLCTSLIPQSFDMFSVLIKSFVGGYTHANRLYSGEILENVKSKDISSSYPFAMVSELYPMTKFSKTQLHAFYEIKKDYAKIYRLQLYDIESKLYSTFLSRSKCEIVKKPVVDNGRIIKADYVEVYMLDVDFEIFKKCYEYDNCIISEMYISKKGRLPKKLVEFILELFANKTELKGIDEMLELYAKYKEFINSLYGMCVTNNIRDEVNIRDGEWIKTILTADDVTKKLESDRSKPFKNFMAYQWGIYIPAYGRKNLWKGIVEIDSDNIYDDTDSIKYIGDYEYFFEQYNANVIKKLDEMCEYYGFEKNIYRPKDRKGDVHIIGLFETEKSYDKFITLGAKKYAYIQDGKIHITVSGVSKKASSQLRTLEDFKDGFEFDFKHSGKIGMTYLTNQREIVWNNGKHDEFKSDYKFGIHAMPTTYTLGVTEDYLQVIADAQAPQAEIFSNRR